MNDDSTASAVAETVTPLGVRAYLAARGWTRTGSYLIDRGDVYRRPDDRETAAAELIDIGGGLEVSVSWALTRPPSEEHDEQRSTVIFQPPDARVLSEAARILGSRQERVDERIEGYVSALARDQSEPDGRATIKAVIDGALTSVKADFSPSEYSEITKAHDNRWSVSLEADLHRDGQRWRLSNPRDLTVTDDNDP